LLERLEFLAKQKDMLGLKQDTCASNEGGVSWKPSERLPTTSLVDESGIFGRDDDKEEIIKSLLLDIDCGNQVPIVSIVGLGGMGKTTLAQLVYNDQRIKENFEHRAWVYVSETFDVIGLTKAILRSFHSSADGEDLNLLQNQLQQRLTGKKYLLVLDDVWNRSEECWERLLLPLYHGSVGSKIIVTTRDKEVASVM
jgi:predicted AAA+ superfamily ATPase